MRLTFPPVGVLSSVLSDGHVLFIYGRVRVRVTVAAPLPLSLLSLSGGKRKKRTKIKSIFLRLHAHMLGQNWIFCPLQERSSISEAESFKR